MAENWLRAHLGAGMRRSLPFLVALVFLASVQSAGAVFTSTASASHSPSSATCFYRATLQKGSTTSTANGTRTVTITAVNTSRAFLIFTSRSNLNRPVVSQIGGRIASATTIEFIRNTNEASPVTVTIEWTVVEYNCGVNVQRGSFAFSATPTDVTITPVNSTAAAFVIWSKTPNATDAASSNNDPTLGELTSTSNVQFRMDSPDSTHTVYWQVVEFTDATKINVQRGLTSLTGAATSTTATLGTAVSTTKAFVLVGGRSSPPGNDISSAMVRGRLTDATTVTLDRSTSSFDVTEIGWQVIELKDGSSVQSGSTNFPTSTATVTASISAVTTARTSVFASNQSGAGQTAGRTSYTGDDIVGVATATITLTSTTQISLTRDNTAGASDIAWSVVSWGLA